MKKENNFYNKYLSGKPLLLIHFMSSLTACTLVMYLIDDVKLDFYNQLANMFILVIVGVIVGTILLFANKKVKLIWYDKAYFILLQPIYLLVVGVFFVLLKVVHFNIFISVILAIYFLLGLACGIFDYRKIELKKYLILGCIPVIVSIIYYMYFSESMILSDYIIYSSLVYLCTLLLVMNRIKLDRVIYSSKEINLKNKYRIRIRNDIKIVAMFLGFSVAFFVLKYSTYLNNIFSKFINWLFGKIPHFGQSEAIYDDFEQPVFDLPKSASSLEKNVFIIIISLIALALIISLLVAIIMALKYLYVKSKRLRFKKEHYKSIIMKNDEFEEVTEIMDEKRAKTPSQNKIKFLYDLSKIRNIEDEKMKLRYLYGYNLEQMIYYGIKIKKHQTPVEILSLVKNNKLGDIYATDYFSKITNEYIKTRYGDKDPNFSYLHINELRKYKRDFHKYLKKASD